MALAIVGALLLSGLALFALEGGARRRVAAHAAAESALVRAWEELRAGRMPLATGAIEETFEADDAALALEVYGTATADLYRLRLVASYRATGRSFSRSLEGLLWRP